MNNYPADNGSYSLNCGGQNYCNYILCPQKSEYRYEVPAAADCSYTEKGPEIKHNNSNTAELTLITNYYLSFAPCWQWPVIEQV